MGSHLTVEKMRRGLAALRDAQRIHERNMADPVYVAIAMGLACPLPLPIK